MITTLLLLLVVASWMYWLTALWLVREFFQEEPAPVSASFAPPVSILKAVKGLDAQAYQNFVSFCEQDYPAYEILFGVDDPADPAVPVIERLRDAFPQLRIRLVVAPVIGANRKASILHELATQARHDILVASDSDMRVTPDYLRRAVAPLADPAVGLVTCPYRGKEAHTLTARLEALHMGVTFLPSVVVARKFLNMRFALGSSMALRRHDLELVGGFAAISEYLADDYQIGARIFDLGRRVCLSTYVIASVLGATSFREQWDREVRWARTTRASRPWEYTALWITFSTPLATGLLLAAGFGPTACLALITSLLLRWLVAWLVPDYTGDDGVRRWLAWLPVRDMLSALVWVMGLLSKRIVWRGEEYIVLRGGRLQPRHSRLAEAAHKGG